jgi:hypothetical protein
MSDCFISYTKADASFARGVARILSEQNVKAFVAELSLEAGVMWSERIKQELNQSKWVLFLASEASIASPAVQQEVGGAVFGGKRLIPIVWDVDPSELPAWAKEHQAVDLRGLSADQVLARMQELARAIRGEVVTANAIGIALLAGLAIVLLGSK